MVSKRSTVRVEYFAVIFLIICAVQVCRHLAQEHYLLGIISQSRTFSWGIASYLRDNGFYPSDFQTLRAQDVDVEAIYSKFFAQKIPITYTKPSGESGVESRMLVIDLDDYEIIYDSEFHRTVREK